MITPKAKFIIEADTLADLYLICVETAKQLEPQYKNITKAIEANTIKIDDLQLTVRTQNLLRHLDCDTVADVLKSYTKSMLLKQANFGRKSLNELVEVFAGLGYLIND